MIKFAVVGCGRIATKKHFGAIKKAKGKIVLVCDIDKKKAMEFGLKLNCNSTNDFDVVLMATEMVDVIDICTPSGLHPEMAIKALEKGFHVISEKPMALKTIDAKRMIATAKKHNKKLFIVKQNRFNPPIIKLKEMIDKKRFGKLISGTVCVRWFRNYSYYKDWHGTRKLDGTVLHNQASHHVDLLVWLLGKPVSVFAYGSKTHGNIEVNDTIHAIIKFKNGAIGNIEATTCAFNRNPAIQNDMEGSITILGERGAVKVGGYAVNKIEHWDFIDWKKEDNNIKEVSTNPPNVYGFGHNEFMKHVVQVLKKGGKYLSGDEGIKSLELIEAICKSIKTRKEVKL